MKIIPHKNRVTYLPDTTGHFSGEGQVHQDVMGQYRALEKAYSGDALIFLAKKGNDLGIVFLFRVTDKVAEATVITTPDDLELDIDAKVKEAAAARPCSRAPFFPGDVFVPHAEIVKP